MSNVEVVGLSYYPIKSCGAVNAQEVSFSEYGIENDREWMVVDRKKARPLTQRILPELALVEPEINDESLQVTAPGVGRFVLSLERDTGAQVVQVNLWQRPGSGIDQGVEANGTLSEYLKRDVRLLRVHRPRYIVPEFRVDGAVQRTGFADGFPMLLASHDSLAALNGQLEVPVPMNRFRPNIVVAGGPEYDEDYWRALRIGALRCFIVRACMRCPMPNIDQGVGVLPEFRAVTEALRATRRGIDPVGPERGVFFGQNMVHVVEPGAKVKVHDQVEVMTRDVNRNWQEAA
jgi:uncharacterized protein YcbX